MNILIYLIINIPLRVLFPNLFFVAPLLLIYFLRQNKNFIPFLTVVSILEDIITILPIGFHLFVTSLSFLLILYILKFLNTNKISGLLICMYIYLLLYSGFLMLIYKNYSLNYFAYKFLFNASYSTLFLFIYKIIM